MIYGIRGTPQFEIPLAELAPLRRERDPELRGEAMLALAAGCLARSHVEFAVSLYSELSQNAEFPASIRERANAHLAALGGEGRPGDRAEALASRFLQEAADPALLFGMTVAGTAFRATRFFSLAHLASEAPPLLSLGRGLGSQVFAGLAGFGVEAMIFPLALRLGHHVLGRELSWSRSVLGREWASSFLTLGALRAGGLLTGALAPRPGLLRLGLRESGLFGGILLAHELEARAGLRERLQGSDLLIDSLATLLHFQVGGRLSRSLLGERWRHWEEGLVQRSFALERIPFQPLPFSLRPDPAFVGLAPASRPFREVCSTDVVFMGQGSDGGGKGPRHRPDINVISLEEFRQRRRGLARPRNRITDKEPKESRPQRDSETAAWNGFLDGPRHELWRNELADAVRSWVTNDAIQADRERYTIERRLETHPPAFRDMIAYLATHHPLAAQLMMVRHDLLAENSVFRRHPMLRRSQWITDFYSNEELGDIYERIWLRYVQRLRYDEANFSLYDVPMSSPEFFENLKRTHPALVAALIHPDLPAEIFMPLIQSLEIFPSPRSSE